SKPVLTPADLFVLGARSGPAAVVKDALMGGAAARLASGDARHVQAGGYMRPAGMGAGARRWQDDGYRGDHLLWVTGGIADQPDGTGPGLEAVLRKLASIGKELRASRLGKELGLVPRTSVQLAWYPGAGRGYVKHLDADGGVHAESTSSSAEDTDSSPRRTVTAVYYLNPDWCARDGGCLRVHLGGNKGAGGGQLGGGTWDVEPVLDRVVLFRSNIVEHEVLPSFAPRFALTMWFYGRPPRRAAPAAAPTMLAPVSWPPAAAAQAAAAAAPLTAEGDTRAQLAPLPLGDAPDLTSEIFVSIVSYRDPEALPTIADLLSTAAAPQRVRVGLVLHSGAAATAEGAAAAAALLLPPALRGRVATIVMDAAEAAGPCWARHVAAALWRGEPYVLQSDSHMRFRRNWDAYLLATLRRCPSPRPILTTYPSGYELPNRVPTGPEQTQATVLCPMGFGADGMLRQRARRVAQQQRASSAAAAAEPLRSVLWAAGFNFGPSGALLRDARYDPALRHVFFGEEAAMAARLFTAGYDFYAPPQAVAYHLWTRAHRPSFRENETAETARERQRGEARIRAVLGMPPAAAAAAAAAAAGGAAAAAAAAESSAQQCADSSDEDADDGAALLPAAAAGAAGAGSVVDLGEYGLGKERTLAQVHVGVCSENVGAEPM
ncbi:hypothetical protein JKP88DRAFT_169463, partial [Tribonema minus]